MIVVAVAFICMALTFPSFWFSQTAAAPDEWQALKYFVGKWEGTGKVKPRVSRIEREFRWVLNNKFLQISNRSVYDPQPQNPKGELHEDWGLVSFDKGRKRFVLRQFHVEGFVNQYVASVPGGNEPIVFTSESIENIPAGWRARETYKIVSADEFIEIFELAAPGKDFEIYSESRLHRQK